ncbi:tryptophan synthase subunit beta [Pseudomonas sp. UBA2684]|uniref:tryptophan synthase subunit beta n=1 Tax=Pseudomonas sp. UBA2684 TaxID=1947311 RepID=UPI000E926062|nr:tryptophan synthase subunit beta [Pseudomonas sp. UBA2684]HBX55529.1 tryptophan synthase subunit beta [Pseudomonas sp.]|tara:strand:- start:369 stop:707 length:339 start_codon:yes stop_codon:yes gene_type:complete
MLYVKRDAWGNLQQVETTPFEGMDGELLADSQEAQAWYANQTVESSLLQLQQSDLDMIRVLEDLITVLIRNGVVRITDLPEAAQSKLVGRSKARDALGGLQRLINDDEAKLI